MANTLSSLIQPELLLPSVGGDRDSVLRLFANRIAARAELDETEVFRGLAEREELGSTAIGAGVAVPHCRTPDRQDLIVAVGIAPEGVEFGAADGRPVRLFFVIVAPKADPAQNLRALSAVSRWVQCEGNVDRLLQEPTREAMARALASLE